MAQPSPDQPKTLLAQDFALEMTCDSFKWRWEACFLGYKLSAELISKHLIFPLISANHLAFSSADAVGEMVDADLEKVIVASWPFSLRKKEQSLTMLPSASACSLLFLIGLHHLHPPLVHCIIFNIGRRQTRTNSKKNSRHSHQTRLIQTPNIINHPAHDRHVQFQHISS